MRPRCGLCVSHWIYIYMYTCMSVPLCLCVCVCVWGVFLVFSPQCARSLFVWAPRCKVVKSPSAWAANASISKHRCRVGGLVYTCVSLFRPLYAYIVCVCVCVCECVCSVHVEEIIIIKRMEKCNCWGKSRRRDECEWESERVRVASADVASLTKHNNKQRANGKCVVVVAVVAMNDN